jgi:FHA domain-containing protein
VNTITLTVTAFNGAPSDGSLSAQFDELGGLIGRADTNQLVLPDPDRSISRVHAQVVFRGKHYAIVDRGSNPILVNGQPAGNDREVPLKSGDRVQIGGYELKVSEGAAAAPGASPSDPFADLLGAAPARPRAGDKATLPDPLAAFGTPGPSPAFGAPGPSPAFGAPGPSPAFGAPPPSGGFGFASPAAPFRAQPPAAATSASGIPADWDPFAPDPVSTAGRPAPAPPGRGASALGLDLGAAAPAALIPDLARSSGGGGGDSLDALFGLSSASAGADPFANSKLDQVVAQPNMAAHSDPLQSLRSAPKASAATLPDDLSDLQRPFMAPTPPRPPAVPPVAQIPPTVTPATSAAPRMPGAVLSWDVGPSDTHTVIRPAAGATAPLPVAPTQAPPILAPARPPAMVAPPPTAPTAPAAPVAPTVPPVAHAAPPAADVQALTAAFREGLDAPMVKLEALTPDLMRLIGQLLREATSGTVDMLVARAAFKREMRADVTMIDAKQNNPLKFSPSGEVALQYLLAPPARGFMAAAPAMRDAHRDLRAHQFGMVAGMKSALDGVLERFDPAELEGKLTERSMLHNILPGSRKARMWEVFVEHFDRIREEASDDFQTLFGRAFLRAYEQHLDDAAQEKRK